MAPSHLQGLNIIHPPAQQNPFISDQDLLAVPNLPDLTAQLDLWTNLSFQSDEPLAASAAREADRSKIASYDEKAKRPFSRTSKDAEWFNTTEEDVQDIGPIAEVQSHENVVTGTLISPQSSGSTSAANSAYPQAHQPLLNLQGLNMNHTLDFNTLLAGFGIDQLQMASVPPLQQSPSLAQMLFLHSAAQNLRPPSQTASAPPPSLSPTSSSQLTVDTSTPSAPKRPRISTSTIRTSIPAVAAESPESPEGDEKQDSPLITGEDKRRRNTAASARFRLKKKEREAALERKAKELEVRVGELEKECEALRRENGWLNGLVVGVTGVGAVQQQQQQAVAAGTKRARGDIEASSA